ncbi:MAG: Elongation factor P--(R)-beta-lysine ligase [Candidatus Anoxychlamydiales bacterium]|nr:Elongation factor P--(R)-beta-lysine ligase [Candidatus Anoxychlamydiales bacterium]
MSPEFHKILLDRALMLKKTRLFFDEKNIIEVDPPHLVKHPSIDLHIESIPASPFKNDIAHLHTSPEYMMKRLIAKGFENIYFLNHVFRKNEIGQKHNIEFTMLEWYRSNTNFQNFIDENIDLIKLFVKFKNFIKISYFDLFYEKFNLDIFKFFEKKDLIDKCKDLNIQISNIQNIEKSDLLNLLFDHFFEKFSKKDVLYLIYDFPTHEAALAKISKKNGKKVAQRFEFFLNNQEIANGYFELNDEKELRKRFEKIISIKKNLSLDEKFLKSINHIGDNLYGIAIGFDRLMMLRHSTQNIEDVIYCSYLNI